MIFQFFFNQNTRNFESFFASSEKKKEVWNRVLSNYLGMTHTSGQLIANQIWEFCLWQSKERATCRQACIVGLWKGQQVSSADWLRDSMWKVPGHQDLWAYLQKLIFWEKRWLHVYEVHGFILFFMPDFLVAFHVGFIPFFLLRWIKINYWKHCIWRLWHVLWGL